MASLFKFHPPTSPGTPAAEDKQDDAQSVSSGSTKSEPTADSTVTSATELSISSPSDTDDTKSGEEDSLPDNPFDSPASRALFDAIDQFQSCGAGEYVDIPQVSDNATSIANDSDMHKASDCWSAICGKVITAPELDRHSFPRWRGLLHSFRYSYRISTHCPEYYQRNQNFNRSA